MWRIKSVWSNILSPILLPLSFLTLVTNASIAATIEEVLTGWHTDGRLESSYIPEDTGVVPMIQGATSETETQFNLLVPRSSRFTFRIVNEANGKEINGIEVTLKEVRFQSKVAKEAGKALKLYVYGLKPSGKYAIEIVDSTTRGRSTMIDRRFFSTTSADQTTPINFACGSCANDSVRFQSEGAVVWKQVERQSNQGILDVFILNGDHTYADSIEHFGLAGPKSEGQIWERVVNSFNSLALTRFKRLVPVLGNMDDHDWGKNDATVDWINSEPTTLKGKLAAEAKMSWQALWASQEVEGTYKLTEGIGSQLTLRGQHIVILDGRSFRQKKKSKIPYAHLGKEQEDRLIKLMKSTGQPVFIVKGDQFFGHYSGKDSHAKSHPDDFERFLDRLEKTRAPFAFITGDVHFSEVMRIERDGRKQVVLEFTASSIHSFKRYVVTNEKTAKKFKNQERIDGLVTEQYNFMTFQSVAKSNGFNLKVASWGIADKPYFEAEFEVFRTAEEAAQKATQVTPAEICIKKARH